MVSCFALIRPFFLCRHVLSCVFLSHVICCCLLFAQPDSGFSCSLSPPLSALLLFLLPIRPLFAHIRKNKKSHFVIIPCPFPSSFEGKTHTHTHTSCHNNTHFFLLLLGYLYRHDTPNNLFSSLVPFLRLHDINVSLAAHVSRKPKTTASTTTMTPIQVVAIGGTSSTTTTTTATAAHYANATIALSSLVAAPPV